VRQLVVTVLVVGGQRCGDATLTKAVRELLLLLLSLVVVVVMLVMVVRMVMERRIR